MEVPDVNPESISCTSRGFVDRRTDGGGAGAAENIGIGSAEFSAATIFPAIWIRTASLRRSIGVMVVPAIRGSEVLMFPTS